jgi:uncharacterized protein (DUF302 family)
MDYYISRTIKEKSFSNTEKKVRELLQQQGFGVLTEIDSQAIFKNKLGIDFRPYKILGACNPGFAHEVIEKDDKVGVMLPCNVCIQQKNETEIEVFAVNPLVAMKPVNAEGLEKFADKVYERLTNVLNQL